MFTLPSRPHAFDLRPSYRRPRDSRNARRLALVNSESRRDNAGETKNAPRGPEETRMIKTEGLLHFTIPVKDLKKAEEFYAGILGFEIGRRNNHMLFTHSGDAWFVLTLSEKPVDPNVGDKHEIHTAFRVSGKAYDEAKETLAKHGVKIFKEEDRHDGTFQGRSAYFHDPFRNVIEIMDLHKMGA